MGQSVSEQIAQLSDECLTPGGVPGFRTKFNLLNSLTAQRAQSAPQQPHREPQGGGRAAFKVELQEEA